SFLSQAHILVSAVSGLFFGAGDPDASARLNDISNRIADERDLSTLRAAKPSKPGNIMFSQRTAICISTLRKYGMRFAARLLAASTLRSIRATTASAKANRSF
ncbi:MAG: hypothetical protein WBX25_19825, partial [Rhodomicrobium sp.]